MAPLPEGRREVRPSKEALGRRRGATFGPRLNVSVPISFGLPLIVVGLALVVTAAQNDNVLFWVFGGIGLIGGIALFASGKRL
jgi:hypothetical protein